MAVLIKAKSDLVVPRSIRRRAGIKTGDRIEFKVSGGVINIVPKLPSADDEYTPQERRIIDAQLDEAEKGPFYGPFNTADEMIKHLKGRLKKRSPVRKAKPPR